MQASATVHSITLPLIIGIIVATPLNLPPHLRSSSYYNCPICEPEFCPKTFDECPRGIVQDLCGCCPIGNCLLNIEDRCLDAEQTPRISMTDLGKYGSCGDKMNCVRRTDLEPGDRSESTCVCLDNAQVCGSDNQTYHSSCSLAAANGISVVHTGPCHSPPEIISGPEDAAVAESHSLALDCEVRGFPVPAVSWKFQAAGSHSATLPGDDTSIIVQTRGGPESSMLTSWVQIVSIRPEDAGTYICVASNKLGTARAVSEVQVFPTSK